MTVTWHLERPCSCQTQLCPSPEKLIPSAALMMPGFTLNVWIFLQFLGDLCWHGCSVHGTWPNHSSKNVYDLPGTGQLPLQWWWVKFSRSLMLVNSLELPRCVFPHRSRKNSPAQIAPSEDKISLVGGMVYPSSAFYLHRKGSIQRLPKDASNTLLTRKLRGIGPHTMGLHSQVGHWTYRSHTSWGPLWALQKCRGQSSLYSS